MAYAEINETVVDVETIWTPDATLFNKAEATEDMQSTNRAWVYPDGRVFWSEPAEIKFDCAAAGSGLSRPHSDELAAPHGRKWPQGIDLTLFPFDIQYCELQYGSWTDSDSRVNFSLMGPGNPYVGSVATEGPAVESVSWDVSMIGGEVLNKTYSCCPGSNYPVVHFYLVFRRFHVDYMRNIFVPVCLSVVVGFLAYWIPIEEGERLSLGVTSLLTVLAVMFITNDSLPTTRNFTLLSLFYLGSLCYTIMPLMGSALVIALRSMGDVKLYRGKTRNRALDMLWEITSELMDEEDAAKEAVEAMIQPREQREVETHSLRPEPTTPVGTISRRMKRMTTTMSSAASTASSAAGSFATVVSKVNPLNPMFKALNARYALDEVLRVQLEKVRTRIQMKSAMCGGGFQYGDKGEWPTHEELGNFLDRAGQVVIPTSYFVFLLILNGATVYNNYTALGAGMIVFTIIAVATYVGIFMFQVRQCRHLKQLQNNIYVRDGIENEELSNAEIAQYREDFMEFDKDLDGQIGLHELVSALESSGRKVPLADFMRIIGLVDHDLDRSISFAEFVNLFEMAKMKREMIVKQPSSHKTSRTNPTAAATGTSGEEVAVTNHHNWSSKDVDEWLASEGFGEDIRKLFSKQNISGDVLVALTEEDMKTDLGILKLADRRQLTHAIQGLARVEQYQQVQSVLNMSTSFRSRVNPRGEPTGVSEGVRVRIPPASDEAFGK